jgi:hypothetical protein
MVSWIASSVLGHELPGKLPRLLSFAALVREGDRVTKSPPFAPITATISPSSSERSTPA